jgi:hypothetical protein
MTNERLADAPDVVNEAMAYVRIRLAAGARAHGG